MLISGITLFGCDETGELEGIEVAKSIKTPAEAPDNPTPNDSTSADTHRNPSKDDNLLPP